MGAIQPRHELSKVLSSWNYAGTVRNEALTFENFCQAVCAAQPDLADTEADTGEALVPTALCPHSGLCIWIWIYVYMHIHIYMRRDPAIRIQNKFNIQNYICIYAYICVYTYTYIRRSAGSCHSDPSSSRCTSYSPPSGTISSTTSTASSCSSSQSYSSCPPVSPLSLRTIFTNCFLLLLLHFHYVLSSKSLFCLWWCFHVFM